VNLGSYGEFVYTDTKEPGEPSNWDAQRFILYVGYDFSDKWSLFTEIEIEHADEIFLEQAFLSYKHSDALQFNVGVLLVPVGITNIWHEPTTFLGTQRPEVERRIIPTTWRENGVSLTGKHQNWMYNFAILNPLIGDRFSDDGVRSGRQKASQTNSTSVAFALQTDYVFDKLGYIGASVYTGSAVGEAAQAADVNHTVWDVHANLRHKGFEFRALYTDLTLSNTDELNAVLGNAGTDSVAERMNGYFVEFGYNVLKGRSEHQIIPFFRYEDFDTQASVGSAFTKNEERARTNLVLGFNYKPKPSLVFKIDYTKRDNDADTAFDEWNVGAGWNF
jgi:hypothetical protein